MNTKHLFSKSLFIVTFLLITGSAFGQVQKRVMLNTTTYQLTQSAKDEKYGYSEKNPIKVGGFANNEGPLNEIRFLNGLLGPNGEEVEYERLGSCCLFDTPNNSVYGGKGLLDKYKVTYKGQKKPAILYINMYDQGDLLIPVGFTARGASEKSSPDKFKLSGGHVIESEGLAGFWRQIQLVKGESDLSSYNKSAHYKVLNPDKSLYMFITWPRKDRVTPGGEFYIEPSVTDVSFYGTYSIDSDSTYSEYIVSHALTPRLNGSKSLMKYHFLDKNTIKIGYKNEEIGIWIYEYWKRVLPATK